MTDVEVEEEIIIEIDASKIKEKVVPLRHFCKKGTRFYLLNNINFLNKHHVTAKKNEVS